MKVFPLFDIIVVGLQPGLIDRDFAGAFGE